jgi:hypothetical protein
MNVQYKSGFYNKIYSWKDDVPKVALEISRVLQEIELESALRRELIENERVNERLRRSRVEAAIDL